MRKLAQSFCLLVALGANASAQTRPPAAEVERLRALYETAQRYEGAGYWLAAEETWTEVLKLAPEDARAWVNLGVARNRQEKSSEAIEAWTRAAALDPKLAGAHFNIGLALVRRGQFIEAISPLRRALALEPENEAARRSLAVALVGAERYPEATREIAQLLVRAPRDAALLELAAQTFMSQRRYKEAVVVLGRRLELDEGTARLWAMYGDALDGASRTGEAASAYERAVALAPDSTTVRYALGYLYWKLYRYEEAERALTEVLKRDSSDARAAFTLGDLHLTRGDAARALPHLEHAARVFPSEFDTRFALGRALARIGETERAISELRAAVAINQTIADGHYQLGRALMQAGRREEGMRELERAKRLNEAKREAEAPRPSP